MPVRSGVLARWTSAVGALTSPPFVVPVTDTWILKSLRVHNLNAAASQITPFVAAAVGGEFSYVMNQLLAIGGLVEWNGWLAIGPGDSLSFQAQRDLVHFWASGAALPGHL